jgi:parvulin-like peptidyl-prolyl isomerase
MDETYANTTGRCTLLCAVIALLLTGCDALGTTKKFHNPVMPPPPRARLLGKNAENASNASRSRLIADGSSDSHAGDEDETSLADASEGRASLSGDANGADLAAGRNGRGAGVRTAAASKKLPGGEPASADADEEAITQTATSREASDGWKGNAADRGTTRSSARPKRRPSTEELTAVQSDTVTEGAGRRVGRGEVAATVNGRPIFADDVLQPVSRQLAEAEKHLPPEVVRKQRSSLIEKMIQPHIERELLLQALRTKVKEEQLTQIQKHIDVEFDEELREKLKASGMSTPGEFEVHLRRAGSSLEIYKTNYRNQRLAQQYMQSQATHKQTGFDRPDMIDHWKGNPEKYAIPGRVKWQQIRLTNSKHGGKQKTQQLADEIVAALENGGDFAELARQHSDGATASAGGRWDWTNAGSLASKELDQALFEMPVGEEFAMIESKEAINIILVLDRQEAGTMAFESVQTDIKNELKAAAQMKFIKELLAELRENATIEMQTESM